MEALLKVGQTFTAEFVEWAKDHTSRRMYTTMLKIVRTRAEAL